MNKKPQLPHKITKDISFALSLNPKTKDLWDSITPLARNEFICWITSAKKDETRKKRIRRLCEELLEGKRRPCCWPGCPHRK